MGVLFFVNKNGYAAAGCHAERNQQVIHVGFCINDDFANIGSSM